MEEKEIPWSMVVESDKVYSAKTKKWYEVIHVSNKPNGTTVIRLKGLPVINPKSDDLVKVQRGKTGEAVDMFVHIFYSG